MEELFTPKGGVELGILDVHLTNGEDIVGKVFRMEDGLRIEQPVSPTVQQEDGTGRLRIGMMPFRPWLQEVDVITIAEGHVLFTAPVSGQMEEMYRRMHSNITLASPANLSSLLNPTK